MSKRDLSRAQVAELIDRFLNGESRYPQEWNDFVECSQRSAEIERYRQICYELDPLVNRPEPIDPEGLAKLKSLALELRSHASD